MCKDTNEKYALSKYVEVIEYGNQFILFNKLNGGIVLMDSDKICFNDTDTYLTCLKEMELEYLTEEHFFADEQSVQKYIADNLKFAQTGGNTNIVISVTEKCNLNCKYCYQSDWDRHEKIDDREYLLLLVEYIKSILPKIYETNGRLLIQFIGGEPLLKKKLILEIKEAIDSLNIYGVDVYYTIDTNIMFLTREFLEQFKKITINTTLTAPHDHNRLRSNSYDAVLERLQELAGLFEQENYKLTIRYNVHQDNVAELESVIDVLEGMNLKFAMDVQNITNTEGAVFKNKLSDEDFDEIYLNQIAPILQKHSLEPDVLPQYGISRHCSASNKLNCKFYANGRKVLCNAMFKTLKEMQEEYLPELPEMCIRCIDFPYCGGPKLCEPECSGAFRDKEGVRQRIIKYVQLCGEE